MHCVSFQGQLVSKFAGRKPKTSFFLTVRQIRDPIAIWIGLKQTKNCVKLNQGTIKSCQLFTLLVYLDNSPPWKLTISENYIVLRFRKFHLRLTMTPPILNNVKKKNLNRKQLIHKNCKNQIFLWPDMKSTNVKKARFQPNLQEFISASTCIFNKFEHLNMRFNKELWLTIYFSLLPWS